MLEVRNLSKSFPIDGSRESVVLHEVSFTLPDKGFYFVIGKSGCGKSTLLNLLMGLMKPDEGSIFFEGKDVSKFNNAELSDYLKDDIGIIFQSYNLLNGYTVKENLKIASSIKGVDEKEKINTLLLRYGLYDKEDFLVDKLSGGEKQRLALIRALISSPKILFCDEPTGALDKANSLLLMEELRTLSKKILVVCVSHNNELFNYFADGIIEIVNGKAITKFKHVINKEKSNKETVEENKFKSKIPNSITVTNMKRNFKYNVINSVSAAFSLFIMVISLFFNSGIQSSREVLAKSYADYNLYQISKSEEEEIKDSLVSLVKSEKPSYEEVQTLFYEVKDCLIFDDFSYFNNGEKAIFNGEKRLTDFAIKPYFNKSYETNDLIVNTLFAENYKKEFGFDLRTDDEVEIELKRDYLYFLKNLIAEKTSEVEGANVSFYDLLTRANSDDSITNYSYQIVALSEESNKKIREMIEEESSANLTISNTSNTLVNSFLTLSESIFLGINIFIITALLTSIFISGFLSYSTSLRNRKQSAILSVLGAKKRDIIKIYLKEEMNYTIIGLFLGLLLTIGASLLLNNYLSGFFVTNNLIKINYLTTFFIMILLMILSYSVDYLTLKFQKEKKVYEELKEE